MMKKIVLGLALVLVFAMPVFATDSGTVPIGTPTFTLGYQNSAEVVQQFLGVPALFSLAVANLQAADQGTAIVAQTLVADAAQCGPLTSIAGKNIAILNHKASFVLTPGGGTAPFPNIWARRSYPNTSANQAGASFDDPADFLTGTGVANFYQSGLAIQAPYYADSATPATNWQVFVYTNKDMLTTTQPAAGACRILDPEYATLRWFAWPDGMTAGDVVPYKEWKVNTTTGTDEFNTAPMINSATPAIIKAALIGTTGTSLPEGAAPIWVANPGGLAVGTIGFNPARNTAVNGFTIPGRSHVGLAYVAPPVTNPTRFRNQKLHMQFVAVWPAVGVSVVSGNGCAVNIYQRTDI